MSNNYSRSRNLYGRLVFNNRLLVVCDLRKVITIFSRFPGFANSPGLPSFAKMIPLEHPYCVNMVKQPGGPLAGFGNSIPYRRLYQGWLTFLQRIHWKPSSA